MMRWFRENMLLFLVVTVIVLLMLRQKTKRLDYAAVHASEAETERLDVPSDWQQYWKDIDERRADSLRQLRALEKARQLTDTLPEAYAAKSTQKAEKTSEKVTEKPTVTSKSVEPVLEKNDRLAIVVVGSFRERTHAEAALKKLKAAGFADARLLMKKGSPNILAAASVGFSRPNANQINATARRKGFQSYVLDAPSKEIFNQ